MTGRLRAWTIACACAVAAASCVPSAASPATDVVPADSRAGQRPTPVEASAPAAGVATPRDQHAIAYALASPAERMDLYLPTTGDGPFPVVLWIHGGGWERGDRTLGPDAPSRELLSAGYAVASVDYRLSREAVFPAQILDVKAAVRYLRAHATALSVDANRIGAWGDSAGGHLVALLATSGDVRAFDDPALGSIDDSSRIQAAVDWYGPISFSTMDAQFAEDGCAKRVAPASSVESRLLGAAVPTRPDLVLAASPITYVTADDPPMLIEHGNTDCTVPWQQSRQLVGALEAQIGKANVSMVVFDGSGHGGPAFLAAANLALVRRFFDAHLR